MPYALAASLVQALAQRLDAALVETHISWVLLTPTQVYKVKKPLRLPFVDYGSLAQRRQCCEEELRLNARLAPSLYLGLTRITGNPQVPGLDGPGPTLEYAVRMRRFADGALFAECPGALAWRRRRRCAGGDAVAALWGAGGGQ